VQFIQLSAPAKLNLFLHVLDKRADGYHNIQTVFQFIDLVDTLSFRCRNDPGICLTPLLMGLPSRDNLIYKAAHLLQQHTGCQYGVDISFEKNIPMGAGLGGGSSDAAATLLALNKLWKLRLSEAELFVLARQLGADVPIFVHGRAAWAEGIGDQFTPILLPQPWYLIVVPACHVATKDIFQQHQLTCSSDPLKIRDYRLGQGANDFESLVSKKYPDVGKALQWLRSYGDAKLTGTGAAVFITFDSEQEAGRIAAKVPSKMKGIVARGLNRSPALLAVNES
jgi:4-diphosphocytidyl-2-C-methyl-D-erythritol kinase